MRAATISKFRCSTASMSPRTPARASCIPRPATARTTSRSGRRTRAICRSLGIDPVVPDTVGPDGYYRKHVPLFGGGEPKRVIDDKGHFGKLDDLRYGNAAVIAALKEAGALAAMNPRHKHDYAHSWRSKAPIIYRNTPQWFIAMDKPTATKGPSKASLRELALKSIGETRFVPAAGPQPHRRHGRAAPRLGDLAPARLGRADHGFRPQGNGRGDPERQIQGLQGAAEAHLRCLQGRGRGRLVRGGRGRSASSMGSWRRPPIGSRCATFSTCGSTPAPRMPSCLEKRKDLKWPADLYLEGSDQHRGWFQSSLLEACGTRGRAPFDAVLTHGFVMDELGRKMSKSLGNTVAPQDVIKQSGADILRLWALSSDYTEDLRIGPHIIQSTVDAYRKLRNTLRYLLGSLAHYEPEFEVAHADMPELERWVLHRVAEIDAQIRRDYNDFDFKRAYRTIADFCSNDLSAIYFDIRKDALYCEAYSSLKRRAALTVLNTLFECLTAWLAPLLCFTAEEAWLARYGEVKNGSVHLRSFPGNPGELARRRAWRWSHDASGGSEVKVEADGKAIVVTARLGGGDRWVFPKLVLQDEERLPADLAPCGRRSRSWRARRRSARSSPRRTGPATWSTSCRRRRRERPSSAPRSSRRPITGRAGRSPTRTAVSTPTRYAPWPSGATRSRRR